MTLLAHIATCAQESPAIPSSWAKIGTDMAHWKENGEVVTGLL